MLQPPISIEQLRPLTANVSKVLSKSVGANNYVWSSAGAYVGKSAVPAFLTVAEVLGHFGAQP
jgi:hypothetical protein